MRVPPANAWLSPADVGRRVSVRSQPITGLRDTVGTLTAWTGGATGSFTVEGKSGRSTTIKTTEVTAARVVPPEVSAVRLQQIAEAAWPVTDHESLGDWMLRFGGGDARRTNSARITGVPNGAVGHALDYVGEWYERRGIKANIQTPVPGALDDVLLGAGWTPHSESHVLVKELTSHATSDAPFDLAPSQDWLAVAAPDMARGLAEPMMAAMHQRFVTVYDDTQPVAVGRVVGHAGWGIITSVRTVETARRRGHARNVMQALESAAYSMGCTDVMLQVLIDNDKAVAMYTNLGYTSHHRYRYFLAP